MPKAVFVDVAFLHISSFLTPKQPVLTMLLTYNNLLSA